MIVLAVVAVVMMIGAPELGLFVADQRVRAALSEVHGDLAFARADAINNQRRIVIERTGAQWNNGWRICIDPDGNRMCGANAEEILRVTQGFAGRVEACSNVADFADTIVFRPDGRIERTAPAADADRITVSDNMGDADPANDKIRSIFFGPAGRMSTFIQNGGINGGLAC